MTGSSGLFNGFLGAIFSSIPPSLDGRGRGRVFFHPATPTPPSPIKGEGVQNHPIGFITGFCFRLAIFFTRRIISLLTQKYRIMPMTMPTAA